MKIKRSKLLLIAGIVIVICLCFFLLVGFLTDFLWFKELGYVAVFFKQLITQLEFGIPLFLILSAVCYLYMLSMKKRYYKKVITADPEAADSKKLNIVATVLSIVYGLIMAIPIAGELWFEILQFIHSTDFGITDPVFNRDVSFYIFKLDFINDINTFLIGIVFGFAVMIFLYYFIMISMSKPHIFDEQEIPPEEGPRPSPKSEIFGRMFKTNIRGNFYAPKDTKRVMDKSNIGNLFSIAGGNIKLLGVIMFLMIGLHFFLSQFTLLYTSSSGVVYGAGYADINVTLWVYRLLMLLSLAGAVMFIIGFQRRKLKQILIVPIAMVAVVLLGFGGTLLVQNLVVAPDEINKEYKYLENNIAFTRYAYDIQDITIKSFAANNQLTKDDILNNMETISNIRINDYEPAKKFYNQTQSIRTYYEFNDVDVDRYWVNGEYTQVFLSPREIDESATTEQWLTKHLKYTHGYGITLSRVDKVTESGQPDMLIDSIPPVSEIKEIQVTRPEIYFGEATSNYIVVNTDEQEFDYPSGDNNVYTMYEGAAGIKLNLFNRTLFAVREGSLKLMVSTNIDRDSRIIINRNIMDRVKTIAPFLGYDNDPYIVTVDGGLYWILDAYTVSGNYPYSEPFVADSSLNYIRNSVKVVIDAYNGTTDFYVVDAEDPLALTLQKIYPTLFKDFSQMPEALQAHIRYPDTMFTVQADVYTKYHMTDVNVFYQKEDAWNIATEIYGTAETTMIPNYYIMKLPGESKAEFISSIPYTPAGKFNMTALLVARSDGEDYGDLVLYQLPKDRIIYGPRQIESQINQDTEIAQDFTLWSSAGSIYSRGNMFVVPLEESLMYVEPIYLESANSSLPEVKRVIIYYNDRIAYSETLAGALNEMFGSGSGALLGGGQTGQGGGTVSEGSGDLSFADIAAKANQAYNNAVMAQEAGDWAAYGNYLKDLERYLQMLTQ